jgi:lysophospholipid acyltransferase (LPLAT)-like uncharacterized protein
MSLFKRIVLDALKEGYNVAMTDDVPKVARQRLHEEPDRVIARAHAIVDRARPQS